MCSLFPAADDVGLRRVSRFLAMFCLFLAVLFPVAMVWSWFTAEPSARVADLALPGLTAEYAGVWQVGICGLLTAVPALIGATALLAARRCFLAFGRGAYLTMPAVLALRAFGSRVTAAALACLVVPTVVGLVMTLNNPAGQRILLVGVDEQVLLGLLFGGTLWVMAAVMARAVSIAEDNAQIV